LQKELFKIKYISDYVLNIAFVIILNVIVESVMPSNHFKKYVKSVMGLVVIIVLANPVLKFSDFDLQLEKYILSDSFNYEESETEDSFFEENVNDEFEKNLSQNIKKDIENNFGIECEVFVECENINIKSVKIKCEEKDFLNIKNLIDKKYGLECVKY